MTKIVWVLGGVVGLALTYLRYRLYKSDKDMDIRLSKLEYKVTISEIKEAAFQQVQSANETFRGKLVAIAEQVPEIKSQKIIDMDIDLEKEINVIEKSRDEAIQAIPKPKALKLE